jgi:predicted nucleotidyltransferase
MMVTDSLITSIQTIVANIRSTNIRGVEFYIFGSLLYTNAPRDIDILIVYDPYGISLGEVIKLKHTLGQIIGQKTRRDVDICMLSYSEACQSQFISKEKCRIIA